MDSDECRQAIDAWQRAEKAYADEARRYFGLGGGDPERSLNLDRLEELTAFRQAAERAQQHYRRVCWGI